MCDYTIWPNSIPPKNLFNKVTQIQLGRYKFEGGNDKTVTSNNEQVNPYLVSISPILLLEQNFLKIIFHIQMLMIVHHQISLPSKVSYHQIHHHIHQRPHQSMHTLNLLHQI